MGFCAEGEDQYDAFLSYAHADDVAHNGWVAAFERYLAEQTKAQLECSDGVEDLDASKFIACRDKTGFPQGGSLDAVIEQNVRRSQFLFLFLGNAYLKSEYCLKELDIFRENVGGTVESALKHLYVIVIDREALEKLHEGEPDNLPRDRRHLWQRLRDLTQKGIRKEDFLCDDHLLPVYRDDRADPDFHDRCTPLIKEFVRKLIARRGELKPLPAAAPIAHAGEETIAIGAVPERMEPARQELINAFGNSRIDVISRDDLSQRQDEVRSRLSSARVLVIPFDRQAVILPQSDQGGGHLALQQRLFEESRIGQADAGGASILWWEPEGLAPDTVSAAQPIHPFDEGFLEKLPPDSVRHCDVRALASELCRPTAKHSVTARVWVEWSEAEKKHVESAESIVREAFDQLCAEYKHQHGIECEAKLEFGEICWRFLQQELQLAEQSDGELMPDGLVIVCNNKKDYQALRAQVQLVSDARQVLRRQLFPGLFFMSPELLFRPSDQWSVLRFTAMDGDLSYDEEELSRFVYSLLEILKDKYFGNRESCSIEADTG